MSEEKGINSITFSDPESGHSETITAEEAKHMKNNLGVIGEAPDYSDYKEYWTIPKRVFAKRLNEAKSIRIVKNGVEGWLDGEPGHIHVIDNSGDTQKEMIYTEEAFSKKFDKLNVQSPLFNDDDEG